MSIIILVCLTVLGTLLLLKTATVVHTVVWTWHKGERYARLVFEIPPADRRQENLGKVVIELGGHRGPLGIYPKPYWEQAILPLRPPRPLRDRLEGLLRTAMSLWLLIPVGGLLLNASTCFPTDARLSKVESSIGYGCALLLVVAMFASVMLTFISNVLIGELSLLHLGLGGEYNGPVRIAQGRMATLMGSGLVSWSAAAAAVSYTTLAIGGIDRFPAIADPSSAEVVGRLLESCYFVTLAAVGVTEIAATSAATKLLMLLIIFLGLSLVAFLIGLLVGIVGDTGNPRGETEAHHGAHEPFPDLPEQTHPEISTRSAAHKLALAAGGIAAIAVGVNAVRRICR